MGSLTNFGENAMLNHIFNSAYTPSSTVYLGLMTGDPGEEGLTTDEPTENGYSRVSIAFDVASSREVINTSILSFPAATTLGWGILTHFGVFDAITGGHMLAYGSLNNSIISVVGVSPEIDDGDVSISVTAGNATNYLANLLLDFMFRNQTFAQPTIFVGLSNVDPTDAGTGSTISEPGGNYSRVAVTDWLDSVSAQVYNNVNIDFLSPTVNWPLIAYSVILDAVTNGNLLMYSTVTTQRSPIIDDSISFQPYKLVITID